MTVRGRCTTRPGRWFMALGRAGGLITESRRDILDPIRDAPLRLVHLPGKLPTKEFVQPGSELTGAHAWLFRAILAPEKGSHPPATFFHGIGEKHRRLGITERGHELVGTSIGKPELAQDEVKSAALKDLHRLFAGGCEADIASSFAQVVFEDWCVPRTFSHKKNCYSASIHTPPFRNHCRYLGVPPHIQEFRGCDEMDFLELSEECRIARRRKPVVS
ncbi:MAG: hypothetical protein WCE53_15325 [Candidatus Acidiferrum sp.]